MKKDYKATFAAMEGLPVTIRLLDPPLHEFLPHNEEEMKKFVWDTLNSGQVIPGFGHAVLR